MPLEADGVVLVVEEDVEEDVEDVEEVVVDTSLVVGVVEIFETFTTRCPVVVPISPVERTRAPFA